MNLPRIKDIVIRETTETPLERPVAVLKTGKGDHGHRFSITGWNPFLTIRGKGEAFTLLKEVFGEYAGAIGARQAMPPLPFSGGAIVALSYDLKNEFESLPHLARDDLRLPDVAALFCRDYLVVHEHTQRSWRIEVVVESPSPPLCKGREGWGRGCTMLLFQYA